MFDHLIVLQAVESLVSTLACTIKGLNYAALFKGFAGSCVTLFTTTMAAVWSWFGTLLGTFETFRLTWPNMACFNTFVAT